MALVIRKPAPEDAERIADICSTGWRQTVEGKMSSKFQQQTVKYWYNPDKVTADIKKAAIPMWLKKTVLSEE